MILFITLLETKSYKTLTREGYEEAKGLLVTEIVTLRDLSGVNSILPLII